MHLDQFLAFDILVLLQLGVGANSSFVDVEVVEFAHRYKLFQLLGIVYATEDMQEVLEVHVYESVGSSACRL